MGMGGINIGMTALQAQRQGLDTTGQNIANANTEGYSRQRVRLTALGAPTRPAFFSQFVSSGSGVQVDGIDRASDRFLQIRSLTEHAAGHTGGRGGIDCEDIKRVDAIRRKRKHDHLHFITHAVLK